MNREQQINVLATDIFSILRSEPMSRAMASMLVDKGYGLTAEVAREIFEELERIGLVLPYDDYAELKKKYTEEGK